MGTPEHGERLAKVETKTERIEQILEEIAPKIERMSARMDKQSGFITGVAATVSAAWALVLFVVEMLFRTKS